MKVGIPRAGLYYVYYPFWKTFLEELGFEVVLSKTTDRGLLEEGLKIANSEMCLPLKIMYGHILELRGKVDAIFLPQMDEVKWGDGTYGTSTYFCPYFVGLADVMKAEFPEQKFWSPLMSFSNYKIEKEPWLKWAESVGANEVKAKKAFARAVDSQNRFRRTLYRENRTPDEVIAGTKSAQLKSGRTIGLVGRAYLVHDRSANLDLIGKINERGFRVRTLEMFSPETLKNAEKTLPWLKRSHWLLTNEEYGALIELSKQSDVTGIIYVVPFNCGPDFVIEDFVIKEIRKRKPVSVISIDESTGEAGLTTRLDAFIDMLPKNNG